jgi:GntR family transcriptional regulator/MocR family aminotransferase
MRELYAGRLGALRESAKRHLDGVLEIPQIEAGLNIPAHLQNGMTSEQAFQQATAAGIEVFTLNRFAMKRQDLQGLSLGFAAFNEREIRQGVAQLAAALNRTSGSRSHRSTV